MGETSYGRSRNLSVNWEFSNLILFCYNHDRRLLFVKCTK